jgi:IS30 family transposase
MRAMTMRPYTRALEQLKAAGLRPTRQRLALAKLLLEKGPRHVTAEELFQEARRADIHVSLATVYNTLHQFTNAGLAGLGGELPRMGDLRRRQLGLATEFAWHTRSRKTAWDCNQADFRPTLAATLLQVKKTGF